MLHNSVPKIDVVETGNCQNHKSFLTLFSICYLQFSAQICPESFLGSSGSVVVLSECFVLKHLGTPIRPRPFFHHFLHFSCFLFVSLFSHPLKILLLAYVIRTTFESECLKFYFCCSLHCARIVTLT